MAFEIIYKQHCYTAIKRPLIKHLPFNHSSEILRILGGLS
jgi:hypothetical protein